MAVCVVLVAATAVTTHIADRVFAAHASDRGAPNGKAPRDVPPWGELNVYDIQIDPPQEYIDLTSTGDRVAIWRFDGMTADQTHGLLVQSGLTDSQVASAMSPDNMTSTGRGTEIRPADDLLLSLDPLVRAQLYTRLAQCGNNVPMMVPYFIPEGNVESLFEGIRLGPEILSVVRSLTYVRGAYHYFSDIELVVNRIPTAEGRLELFKAFTREPAVMARLRIRPDTDIERIAAYWGALPGVRIEDIRPLLEAQRRLPDGGSISLLYLLPRFAREHLYTFPPAVQGHASFDCHWTTMNFFQETPDDRFADAAYTCAFVQSNYFHVASAGLCGDLVLVLNKKGEAIHSAVYLADDIVFTKNGGNSARPWMLMRIKNLVGMYYANANTDDPRISIYRLKTRLAATGR